MQHYTASLEITAPPSRVWAVLVDVERWQEWTPSVTSARRLEPGPLALGSRTRMVQPRLRPVVWHVTQLDQQKGIFIWQGRSPGITIDAGHFVEPAAAGSRATLTVHYSGFLAPFLRLALGKLTQQYIEAEARGLKQRCES